MASPASPDCIELVNLYSGALRLKSSNALDAKKKFALVYAHIGCGRFWYMNEEDDPFPQELIHLSGYAMSVSDKKKKADPDGQTAYQLTLKKDKTVLTFGFASAEEANEWMTRLSCVLAETSPKLIDFSVLDSAMKTNQWVPRFVYYIVKLLESKMETEGMFRLPGSQSLLNSIRSQYLEGQEPLLDGYDVPTLASLLKGYFRELKFPVIPIDMVQRFFVTNMTDDANNATEALCGMVQEIDPANRITLGFLHRFLLKVSKRSTSNKMDVSNLSVAIAPSLFHTPPGMDEMVCATSSNRTMERMITECECIFPSDDAAQELKSPLGTFQPRTLDGRPEMTAAEHQLIAAHLQNRREDVGNCHFCRMLKIVNKSRLDVIVCVGGYRIYVFARGGKLDLDIHYYNLEGVASPGLTSVALTYLGSITHVRSELLLSPLTLSSWDVDVLVYHILRRIEYNFVGAPSDLVTFKLDPDRLRAIRTCIGDVGTADGCCGLLRAYRVAIDYIDAPVSEDLIWSVENIFHHGFMRELVFAECVRKDKQPNEDFRALTMAMSYNIRFTSIQCDNLKLGNDGLAILAAIFRTNKTLYQLKISNVGASSAGFIALADAFTSNDALNLNHLDFSNNPIDDKATEKLTAAIARFRSLVHLDISSCNLSKRGTVLLLEALHQNPAICASLYHLNLTNNALDNADASRQLAALLDKTTALSSLNLTGTNLLFSNATPTAENTSLQTLYLSQTKAYTKVQPDLLAFLSCFPSLRSLHLADLNALPGYLIKNYPERHCANIELLDISDNEFSDEDVAELLGLLLHWPRLEDLRLSRVLTKRSKERAALIATLTSFVEKKAIKTLHLVGSAKSALKTDLLPFVCSLSNNRTLAYLDISKNNSGDELASTMGKLLQINHGLHALRFDDNSISISGFRSIVSGLQRNSHGRCKCYLPISDIINMSKTEGDLSQLTSLVSDFQKISFDNSKSRPNDSPLAQRSENSIRIPGSRRGDRRKPHYRPDRQPHPSAGQQQQQQPIDVSSGPIAPIAPTLPSTPAPPSSLIPSTLPLSLSENTAYDEEASESYGTPASSDQQEYDNSAYDSSS